MEYFENTNLQGITEKIENLKGFLNNNILDNKNADWKYWYDYVNAIKNIMENFNNDVSFIACLMAKEYLCRKHHMKEFDVGKKSQSANGPDIYEQTAEGNYVVAEIKTTLSIKENDLGAQQKESFKKDFMKLKESSAKYKYFFLTEERTYNIIKKRYGPELKDVEAVLLS
jgi:hypothetical protein